MNPSEIDIKTYIEDTVLSELKSKLSGQKFTFERSYGSFSVEFLAESLLNKLSAGVPHISVRMPVFRSSRVLDTLGFVHNATASVEIMVASSIIKEKEFPQFGRYTNYMLSLVRSSLAGFEISIDNRVSSLVWSEEQDLFRIPKMNLDSQRVTYNLSNFTYYINK